MLSVSEGLIPGAFIEARHIFSVEAVRTEIEMF